MKDRLITIAVSVATTWGLLKAEAEPVKELVVDRLVVRNELIVSDTGQPWEAGFETQQIPRGIYARSVGAGGGGLWVRSRLHKAELDDPFDDRFHAMNRDGSPFRAPGHISWNVWLDNAWRQMSIIQGEAMELSEIPAEDWNGGNHPGRLRFQTFRPHHDEPLTDAIIGQGKMSLGGGGFGGGGLPYASDALQLWGGGLSIASIPTPSAPQVIQEAGGSAHRYAIVAVGVQGAKTQPSPEVTASGHATLRWDSVPGGDAYIIVRDGKEIAGPLRVEGSQKEWTDRAE
jgi:hypothetical protein